MQPSNAGTDEPSPWPLPPLLLASCELGNAVDEPLEDVAAEERPIAVEVTDRRRDVKPGPPVRLARHRRVAHRVGQIRQAVGGCGHSSTAWALDHMETVVRPGC